MSIKNVQAVKSLELTFGVTNPVNSSILIVASTSNTVLTHRVTAGLKFSFSASIKQGASQLIIKIIGTFPSLKFRAFYWLISCTTM